MIILDTDIISLVQRDDNREGLRVRARIAQLPRHELTAATVITYEEQIQGWFAAMSLARKPPRNPDREIEVYARLVKHVDNYRNIHVLPFDRQAFTQFEELRKQKIRIGTNDLKIASIALSLDATLITRNLHDFVHVPKLRIEDWTKP